MTRRRRSRWRRRLALVVAAALAVWLVWEWRAWPDVGALRTRNPATTAFIERYRLEQRRAGRPPDVAWAWRPYRAISPDLKRAVLVAEDIGFFAHAGFDVAEMKEAIARALEEGARPRGASTLTQQLAKNLWLSSSYDPLRKAREALLAWQLERTLGKRRILELYLNVVEFGPGIYGAEAASARYFGKPAAALGEDEAAELAAALPRPRTWHPGVTTTAYRRYVGSIRQRMDRAEFLRRLI
jgi:monofunctional biosynthetic peptidoglycan transglycosylase